MQVLLRKSDIRHDIQCDVCQQGFRVFWERTSQAERATMRAIVEAELRHQHFDDPGTSAHPETPFNLPQWSGLPQFSAAALLGGHTDLVTSSDSPSGPLSGYGKKPALSSLP